MKKILFALAFAALSVSAMAQDQISVEHEYGTFTSVTMTDYINATITPSTSHLVRITCDERISDYIIAYVKDGNLDISIDLKAMPADVRKAFKAGTSGTPKEGEAIISGPQIKICLPKLNSLSVNGNSTVRGGDATLSSDRLEIYLKKTASVGDLSLDIDALYIETAQKSKVDIKADAGALNVQAGNSSVVEMKVKAEDVIVNATSFATVEIYGEVETISLECEASAKALYKGQVTDRL